MFNLPFSKALAVCALNLVFCLVAFSQGTTTRITGTITDPQGSPVSGATVTIVREGTGAPLTTQTSDTGQYTFDLIQAGTYEITVEKAGFNKFVSPGNVARINVPTTINVTMIVGDVSATVTVVGAAEAVQTATSGNLGTTIDTKTLESLPIVGTRGRNPLDLLNFQPGVVVGSNTGGGVQVHGSRDRAFNFTLDGIDINDSTAGGSNFTPLRPNPEAIQEFQIITSNPTAEQGRSSGAQVTFVTRSGTNEFHGNLFEFYQTPRFNAKSYPETIARSAKGQFVQHIFGGSFGGPIPDLGWGEGRPLGLLRDKAFFFVNLQMLRAYDSALVNRTVYTQQARDGIFRYVVGRQNANAGSSTAAVDINGSPVLPNCGGAVTTLCIRQYDANANSPIPFDPTLLAYLNSMPLPNNFAGGDGLNTAFFSWTSPQNERQTDFVTKIDYIHNQKNAFYVRYAFGNQNTIGDGANGGRPIFPNSPRLVDTFRSPRNFAANWRFSPTARVTNEFTFGHSRYTFKFDTPFPDPVYNFVFNTVNDLNINDSYNARGVKTNQFIDNITFDLSPHTVKAGINFRLGKHLDDRYSVASSTIEGKVSFSNALSRFNGSIPGIPSFNLPATGSTSINANDQTTLRSMLANYVGFVNSVNRAFVSNGTAFDPPGTRWLNEANYNEYDFYVQDSWKITPNFLLDFGVRWEIKQDPSVNDRPVLVPNQDFRVGSAPSNTLRWVEGELFKSEYGLFLPSVGFAWDPFKDGKTSIRANYRRATDRFATFLFGSSIFQGTPGNNTGVFNTAFGNAGGLWRDVAPVINSLTPTQSPADLAQPTAFGTGSLTVIDPELKYPRIQSILLSFQRELWKNSVFEFNFIHKRGRNLTGGYNVNQANIFATDSRCPNTNFLQDWIAVMAPIAPTQTPCLIGLFRNSSGALYNTTTFRSDFSADNTSQPTFGTGATANSVAATARALALLTGNRSLTSLGFSPYFFMPFPQFSGGLNVIDSNDYSNYKGLEFIFRRRLTAGLGFQSAYTWSVSKDNRSFDPSLTTVSSGTAQSASSTPFDINNRDLNYSWSDFDRRHVFQGSVIWELPFGEGRAFKMNNSVLNYMISGWQLTGGILWQSGRPFTVYTGFNTFSSVVGSLATCDGCPRNLGGLIDEAGRNFWFSTEERSQFGTPGPGEISDIPRNYFIAAPYFQADVSILRKFKLTERFNLDFRVDAKNVLNHPNFDMPTAVLSSSIFGRINDAVTNNPRKIQLSMKLNF
jgi:hypothetical protein